MNFVKGATKATATRYYALGSATAVRTNDNKVTFQVTDAHGTADANIDAATGVLNQHYETPFGQDRGPAPTTWAGTKGFLGGTKDTATGLTHLGARDYDPTTGRFISVDPLLTSSDPQSLNGYTYSDNNPLTFSDPAGTCVTDEGGCYNPHDPNQHDCGGVLTDAPCGTPAASGTGASVPRGSKTPYHIPGTTMSMPYDKKHPLPEEFWRRFYKELAAQYKWWEKAGWGAPGDPLPLTDIAATMMYACDRGHYCTTGQYNYTWDMFSHYNYGNGGPGLYDGHLGGGGDPSELAALRDRALGRSPKLTSCENNSFSPDVKIQLADGKTRAIKGVRVDDLVEAADPQTGKDEGPRRVTATMINYDTNLLDVIVEVDGTRETLHTTTEHPFWDATLGSWVNAAKLTSDHQLATMHGDAPTVIGIKPTYGAADRYNFAVDQLHTYYVLAGGTPVLVHNSQCAVLPSKSTDEYAVIGRKGKNGEEGDVDVALDWEDREVLGLPGWTIEQNDQWIQGVIDSRQKVYVASPEQGNLKSPSGRETVFARELEQLQNAGYTRDGDYLLPPR